MSSTIQTGETEQSVQTETEGRRIGVRHRQKKTVEGDERPTQLAIRGEGKKKSTYLNLNSEQDELDFARGTLAVGWRDVLPEDSLDNIKPRHIKWKEIEEKDTSQYPEHLVRKVRKGVYKVADKVASEFTGMQKGDKFLMILGGSGDPFAFLLIRLGLKTGATVHRISAQKLKEKRGEKGDKDKDADLLIDVFTGDPTLFFEARPRDSALIRVREAFATRQLVMDARIAAENRFRSAFKSRTMLSEPEDYPDDLELALKTAMEEDPGIKHLHKEEKAADAALKKACAGSDVYNSLIEPIEGIGPGIGARIIASVCDVRMFPTAPKLKAFMGAHVRPDGSFPRKQIGKVCNWNPRSRQALFLFVDQCNKRSGTAWNRMLLGAKVKFRVKHPVEIQVARWLSPIFKRLTTTLFNKNPDFVFSKADVKISTADELIALTKEFNPGDDIIAELILQITTAQAAKDRSEKLITIYSKGHIHKMASWRTATKFVEWLWKNWTNLENDRAITPVILSPTSDTGGSKTETGETSPDSADEASAQAA